MERKICPWAIGDLYLRYHDEEWGKPERDDNKLFELLILEGFQAGLSWITVLKKREGFRAAFDGFDPSKIAGYDAEKIAHLMADASIIRNRRKIMATIGNAQAFLRIQNECGGFSAFVWGFVENKPITNAWTQIGEVPCSSEVSDKMSCALKKEGFGFVGSTICYSFMQASGMVNDHLIWCDCYQRNCFTD